MRTKISLSCESDLKTFVNMIILVSSFDAQKYLFHMCISSALSVSKNSISKGSFTILNNSPILFRFLCKETVPVDFKAFHSMSNC